MNLPDAARSYGEFGMVPDRYQDAIRAGLAFFECRLNKRHRWGISIQGPFDVAVSEAEQQVMTTAQSIRYNIRWITDSSRPSIRLQPLKAKSEISVGFIVDDPGWYNRILLADNPPYHVVAYHSQGGVHPASIINPWFDCIREVLFEKKIRYNVIDKEGRLIKDFTDKESAEEFMKTPDDNHGGRLLYPRSKIVESEYFDKTDQVKKIIRENRQIFRGWTNAAEFKPIKAKIQAMIDERIGSLPKTVGTMTLSDIAKMTPEERDAALAALMAMKGQVSRETEKRIDAFGKDGKAMRRGQLETHARNIGVENPESFPNRDTLLDAIVIKQNGDRTIPANIEEIEKEVVT
jgi:hypothetical protein